MWLGTGVDAMHTDDARSLYRASRRGREIRRREENGNKSGIRFLILLYSPYFPAGVPGLRSFDAPATTARALGIGHGLVLYCACSTSIMSRNMDATHILSLRTAWRAESTKGRGGRHVRCIFFQFKSQLRAKSFRVVCRGRFRS
jgi:hypothetical protein